ncbi:MAG: preprotein translocase subunit YajC [Paludibacteraceae bacterium]|nr:preprotein translocase subunit YajC [Candidatus Colousia faecequi]MCQ2337496.1 preprotein translocase subunit YajC [Paludibacteraceae bacterium]
MNLIILQAAQGGGSSSWMNIGMIVLLFVIFYFFMIRPQSKRQKEIRKFQESLSNGKKVITQGGVYGVIREVKDTYVIVEIADGVKIRINKNMVFDSPEDAESQSDKK